MTVSCPDAPVTARGLATWLVRAAPASASGEVTLALVGDGRMRSLNRMFRGKDYATDVLSFPTHVAEGEMLNRGASKRTRSLGDIVIAAGVAKRQAKDAGHSLPTELRVLALHGLLHLLGYDHESDAGEMARAEVRLRRKAGLREGLIARVTR